MMTEEYQHADQILPILTLADPCNVRITVDDEWVRLWVGPRDWQWYRTGPKAGQLMGAGTCVAE
jgi:hypothetical protein